ncbi:hypothetical protein HH212_04950 [Massilia forsythiae]|uniref:Uncharacterized protein n=1 Tax=Massilia forsythiae TaxID=2728020 RepID=A0A7Z2VV28_9BURK|nr:hypothetical protein [Massilia forsythiae]QJD99449.1 hypothetical protein HH212_04950 [Massilia forsythiae]
MRYLDFSSWQAMLTTFLGLAVFTLLGVGIRVLMMQTVQQRRERMNRQINERLRTLIAAYRALGGSFTGQLTVDPTHLRELRMAGQGGAAAAAQAGLVPQTIADNGANSERARRIRDAVEASLADILLLGTEEHCRLAGKAAADMAAGRPIHTAELVIALRDFIREALDLGPMPADVAIPLQGPTRTQGGAAGRGKADGDKGGGKGSGGDGAGAGGEGGGGGGGGGMGGMMGGHGDGAHDHHG